MSTRKLQQEIDKTHKKISEGLVAFDEIYDKLMSPDAPSQKEKLESDLKKEIKKLQRLRDSLKAWITDSSIKLDKGPLQESRSKIEHAMDQFKDIEKMSKIKQFLNEGLELQRAKYGRFGDMEDPKKQEVCHYISDSIDSLNQQNELLEVELHLQTVQLKKAKGTQVALLQSAVDDARYKVERNVKHLTKLEKILRSLENDKVTPELIDSIKDDIEYYVENNMEDDYVEYDDFYDQLNLGDADLDVQGSLVQIDQKEAATLVPPPPPPPGLAHVNSRADSIPTRIAGPSSAPSLAPPSLAPSRQAGMGERGNIGDQPVQPRTELPRLKQTFAETIPRLAQVARERLSRPLATENITQLLELSLLNCPDSFDAEKPRQYEPAHMHPSSIDYPQEPMYELNLGQLMRRFDTDTLFFCFYYGDGVNGQTARHHAALELSQRGWVFNLETSQWFLRDVKNTKGRLANAEKESPDGEGDYKYFDYEKTWLTRRKEKYRIPEFAQHIFSA